LGFLAENVEAEKAAVRALKDGKANVRLAAAMALGSMNAEDATLELKKVLDDSEPGVVLAAAKRLAHDPGRGSADAGVTATTDKNWSEGAAALEAIAQRGDPSLVPRILPALDDAKDAVRFTAAACVAHLSDLPAKKSPAKTAKP
jgi:HEAT repeat protein